MCQLAELSTNFVSQALTPRTSRSTKDETALQGTTDTSKAQLGATVSGQGETAASTVKRAFSTASNLLNLQRHASGHSPTSNLL